MNNELINIGNFKVLLHVKQVKTRYNYQSGFSISNHEGIYIYP